MTHRLIHTAQKLCKSAKIRGKWAPWGFPPARTEAAGDTKPFPFDLGGAELRDCAASDPLPAHIVRAEAPI